ncbi:MAG: thiamine pyrophosphate-binding protein [Aigarchaeota archaeon]|nr:thiamine pyrophosphate-binding protein [Aigarchaeota archaeon]MDW8092731.1 thiamine pyrophosphate-binding protein [Nitrososphaerota archaeon]
MKGADLVVKCLADAGVSHVFGLSGHTTLEVLDAIYRSEKCRFIAVRHEQAASCAADGFARARGRHGVCLGHVGPGNANMVIGVATALRDSSPVLALTCNEDFESLGRDVFQEWDQVSIFRPITKWSAQIRHTREITRVMRNALLKAIIGRPGPVQVDLPMDVMAEDVDGSVPEKVPAYHNYSSRVRPDPELLLKACKMLLEAERPLIVAGGGALWSGASEELIKLAELLYIPVSVTLTGRGVVPDTHPLFVGVLGRWGHVTATDACKESDLILGLGCRFADITTLRWSIIREDSKIIQVDIDPNEIARQYAVDVGMVSDVKMFCRDAIETVKQLQRSPDIKRSERLRLLRAQHEQEVEKLFSGNLDATPIKPQRIVKEVARTLDGNYIITVGAGKHAEFSHKVLIKEPRTYFKSVGFGSMGWAYPAAIGAKLARPEKTVISLVGDGDFAMSVHEIETAVRENVPVIAIIFNDQSFSSIKRFQEVYYGGRIIGSDYRETNFAKIAELSGALGIRVQDPAELGPTLRRVVKEDVPAVIDVVTDPREYPHVTWGIMGLKK